MRFPALIRGLGGPDMRTARPALTCSRRPIAAPDHPAEHPGPRGILRPGENVRVDYARFGWLAVVLVCAITVLILAVQGYAGYAGVTLAVALAAAINLR